MLPILNLGPLALPVPALVLIAGVWICVYVPEKCAPRFGQSPAKISSLILLMIVTGFIGARLIYVFQFPEVFIKNPLDILSRSPGLLEPIGGIAAAVITGIIYSQRQGLPLWRTLDTLVPGVSALAIFTGLSNLASGDAFGTPTGLPWAIYLWGDNRHPTQIYEMILFALLFGFIVANMKRWVVAKPGMLFFFFLGSVSMITIFVESFRGDSLLFHETLRTVQIIAWLVLAVSLWGISVRLEKHTGEEDKWIAGHE